MRDKKEIAKRDRPAVENPLTRSHRRFVISLSIVYLAVWLALAIAPTSRYDWALENIVVLAGILILALTWSRYVFSRTSYLLMTLFLTFHAIGSHYTYSQVPYNDWFELFRSHPLEAGEPVARNHYDRFVHFSYGLLLFYPYRESFLRFAGVRWRFWSYLVPFSFILSTSLIYELLEWAAAVALGEEAGISFLGSQGDIWDAQQDSFCALVGALIAATILEMIYLATKRDRAREWIRISEHGN